MAVGTALEFTAANNSRVTIPYSSDFDMTSDGTIEFWYKCPTQGVYCFIGHHDSNAAFPPGIAVLFHSGMGSGQMWCAVGGTDSWSIWNGVTNAQIYDGGWHHIAITWIFSTGVLEFYFDGTSQGTNDRVDAMNLVWAHPFYVGIRGTSDDGVTLYNGATGAIDEVRLSSIRRYTTDFTPTTTPFTNDGDTVLLLHFDEGTGTDAFDSGSNAHDGTLEPGGTEPTWATGVVDLPGGAFTPSVSFF